MSSATPHVLVLGDLMVDEYVQTVLRPDDDEGGSPIVRADSRERVLGGAGHVATIVAALGGRPTVAGVVGSDEAGQVCRERIAEAHPRAADALIDAVGRPTTVKSRVLADGELIVRVDTEDVSPLELMTERALAETCSRLVSTVDACVVADYGKGGVPLRACRSIIEGAHAARVPVVVDSKGPDYSRYAGADVVTPNAQELFVAAGARESAGTDRLAQSEHAARRLAGRLPGTSVVVTLDRDGLLLVARDGQIAHVPSYATAITDPTGAGDAVTAALSVALGCGRTILDAAELASRVAAIVVARRGTAPIDAAAMADLIGSSRPG
jgi:D-beta-D-heptose 7-phosphate kinase/D-beta-D-heptose 1-phosphate adenosyltransferase